VTFNPNDCASQNYKIIEYLVLAPCAMSTLKILQNCPSQSRTMLSAIGAKDPEESNLITFNMDYFMERVSHDLAFQIQVLVSVHTIRCTVLDEGTSTCVISLPCWRALASPLLTLSPTTFKSFDGHGFKPHGLLKYFFVNLKGKTISVDIEVIDMPLNFNLLHGRIWFYAMTTIASLVFHILRFPHQGNIITVDQLDYTTPDLNNVAENHVPFLGNNSFESVGVGLLKNSSFMGVFPFPSPPTVQVSTLNMILTQAQKSFDSSLPLVVTGLDEHSSSSL
jgi:hypothetical protein